MADVYVKFTAIPVNEQPTATGVCYLENGVAKYKMDMAGIVIANEQQANDPDLGWVDLKPNT